jgi:predicted nuclease with TOPRIM domain
MKNLTLLLFISLCLLSCGNDTALKNDVKSLVELQAKSSELEKELDSLVQKNLELSRTPNSDYVKSYESAREFQDQLKSYTNKMKSLSNEIGRIGDEFGKLDKKLKEKYNSEEDQEKFSIEYARQLREKGL